MAFYLGRILVVVVAVTGWAAEAVPADVAAARVGAVEADPASSCGELHNKCGGWLDKQCCAELKCSHKKHKCVHKKPTPTPGPTPPPGSGTNWAVLVAGSSGYSNYRHQADVCHAYHVMVQGGVSPDKIIVMAQDDIADDEANPFPGKVFNKPTPEGVEGVDVYKGCKIDFKGKQVTPDTFVKVLTGDTTGLVDGAKVLQSTAADRVFINFVDHGGVNLIGFPETTMHATELINAIKTMHSQNMYRELVFYLEACESGSMFVNLPDDINVYATTAANAKESSWGTYCMPDDKVNGKSIGSCLGDLYSVNWMEDSDLHKSGETIQAQMQIVKQETNKSHVTIFGDQTIAQEPLTNFEMMEASDDETETETETRADAAPAPAEPDLRTASAVVSTDAALMSAFHRFLAGTDQRAAEELVVGVQARQLARTRFIAITAQATGMSLQQLPARTSPVDEECHYAAHKQFVAKCGEWHEQALPFSSILADLCEYTHGQSEPIVRAITSVCSA